MARRSLLWFACVVAAALAPLAPASAALEPPAPPTPAPSYLDGRIVVAWEAGASRNDKLIAKRNAEVDSATSLGDPSFQVVEVEPGQTTSDALAELQSDPAVAVATRDALLAPTSVPNDPLFPKQWALQNTGAGIGGFSGALPEADIDATAAWDQFIPPFAGLPGNGAVVADIDSGYRFAGEDLGPVAVPGFDFVGSNADSPSQDSDPTDDDLLTGGHGVHTAGIIAAAGNNGVGISGVAQDARIMPLRVCAYSAKANGSRCPSASVVAAILYAGSHGAEVANISLTVAGATKEVKETGELFRDAMAHSPGTLYVIAAGNDGQSNDTNPHYPCNSEPATSGIGGAVENVVCVGATNQADELAGFSDWGPKNVDLGAPGTEILSTFTFDDLLGIEGENFAAEDFATKWTAVGEGGFGRTSEEPLTSFGMADSPEQAPVAGSTRESVLSTEVPVPSGYSSCRFAGERFVSLGGGVFTQEVSREGTPVFTSQPVNTTGERELVPFSTVPIAGIAGASVRVRFRYEAGPAPTADDGVWLDDLTLTCVQPTEAPPAYAFLEGTSMAAPQVSGAAALIFSKYPGASVTAVRNALLDGVDPDPSLQGKTVTGGRLDAARALAELDTTAPADPVLSTDPPSPASSSAPRIVGAAEPGSTVRVYANASCAGSPMTALSAGALASSGVTVNVPSGTSLAFSATATDAALNVSGCVAISYTNVAALGLSTAPPAPVLPDSPPTCTVPKLAGKSLAKARAALVRAACRAGRVTRSKAKRGQRRSPLVVRSSSPAVGAQPASGVVALRLGPRPKARHKRQH